MSETPEFDQERQVLSDEVLISLELDGLVSSSEKAKQTIAGTVAETMIEVSSILNIPIPEPILLFDWASSEYLSGRGDEDKLGTNGDFPTPGDDFNPVTDKYNIRISPIVLRDCARLIDSRTEALSSSILRRLVAHEMYHQYQFIRFPKTLRMHEENNNPFDEGNDWYKRRVERGAVLFSRKYLKSRRSGNLAEWVAKHQQLDELNDILHLMRKKSREK